MIIRRVFSSFDPSLRIFRFSFIFFIFFFIPIYYFTLRNGVIGIFSIFFSFVYNEGKSLVVEKKGLIGFMVVIIFMVFLMNFLALFPFCYSLTSQLLLTFPLSYSLWLGIIFFTFWSHLKGFFSHLVPLGTPMGLLSFIVVIEFIRNIIRPLALMFRLTANMIAGHLLLSLVGGFLLRINPLFCVLGSPLQGFLVVIELGVRFIQAYVFSTLLFLYISETDH